MEFEVKNLKDIDSLELNQHDLTTSSVLEYFKEMLVSNATNEPIHGNYGNSEHENVTIPIDMRFNDGHLLSIIGYSILFTLSSIGNFAVLILILKGRCRRHFLRFNRIDFMLFHLCIADLIVTLLMMPLEVFWALTVSWHGGDFLCRTMSFCRIFGLYLSSFVVVSLALDRYIAVKYPMKMIGSMRRSKIMIFVSWVLAILCSLPQVFIFHVAKHPVFSWYKQCVSFGSLSERNMLIYNFLVMIMMYALPLVVNIFFYGGIIFELYQQTKKSNLRNSNTKRSNLYSSEQSTSTEEEGLRRSGIGNLEKAKSKILKMTIVISSIFVICWTPYYVMCLWYWIDQNTAVVVDQKVQKALFLFASTNSTANPIVYGIFHFKSAFKEPRSNQSQYSKRERNRINGEDHIVMPSISTTQSRSTTTKLSGSNSKAIIYKSNTSSNFHKEDAACIIPVDSVQSISSSTVRNKVETLNELDML